MLDYEDAIFQTIISFEKLDSEINLNKIKSYYAMDILEDHEASQPWTTWLEGATDTLSTIYDKPYFSVSSSIISQAKMLQSKRDEIRRMKQNEKEKILSDYSLDDLEHLFLELKKIFEE